MNVLFEIEGREAIPVRALAWMTQWHFSADMVLEALETSTYTKKERSFPWASKLRAYRNDGREIQEIEPRYWKNSVVPRIEELLEQKLPRETWEREATKAIPACYFVWRDEWEPVYNGSPDGPDVLDVLDESDDEDDILGRSERTLNFSPAMPDDIEVLVREGFPHFAKVVVGQPAAAAVPVVAPVVSHKLQNKRHPLMPFIAKGRAIASDKENYLTVWPALVQLAQQRDRPPEVVGYVEGKGPETGIQYRSDTGEVGIKYFTKNALRACFERERKSARLSALTHA